MRKLPPLKQPLQLSSSVKQAPPLKMNISMAKHNTFTNPGLREPEAGTTDFQFHSNSGIPDP